MARPLNRNQQLENRAFLKALRRTGNANAAAQLAGVNRRTMALRRKTHPRFALQWEAALVVADAALTRRVQGQGASADRDEPRVVRHRDGRLQLRLARQLRLTREVRQRFLLALSASANVTLSARAAGFSHCAFFRLRQRDPGFAREWRAALAQGYERLQMAVMAGFMPEAHEDDGWRHNDPPEITGVTPAQALQLLYLHQKGVVAPWTAIEKGRRRQPKAVWLQQVRAEYVERVKQEAERSLDETLQRLAARLRRSPHEEPVALPALDQVTGWSRADPASAPRDPTRALFGGFRAEHLSPAQHEARERALARRRGYG